MNPRSGTLTSLPSRSTALQRSLRVLLALFASALSLAVPTPAPASAELQPVRMPFAAAAPMLDGAPIVETKAASSVTQTTATLTATVNPNGGEVTECKFEYGTSTTYGKTAPCVPTPGSGTSPEAVSAAVTGLTPNTTYDFRVVAKNAGGTGEGTNQEFKTQPNAPTVATEPASSITQTSATLNASVNPNGGATSECKFEYGTTTAYAKTAPCSPASVSGTSPQPVFAAITGLSASTTYDFKLVAKNAGGGGEGKNETFNTLEEPPVVETKAASSAGQTTATLNGAVNPNGGATSQCKFEYGTTTAYGKTAPCSPASVSGTSPQPVSAEVTGLAPNTTYDFKLVAKNAGGMGEGKNETFKTLEERPPAPPAVEPTPTSPAPQTPAPPPSSPGPSPKGGSTPVQTGPPAPVLARSLDVAPVTGQVSIRLPGARRFVSLSAERRVPVRTVVETMHGEVSVTAATPRHRTETGEFFDGEFVLTQGRKGRVMATLTGGDFAVCPRKASSRRTSAGHMVRRLWAEVRGDFATTAKYATGIVDGGQWLTEDLCEGTLILATRNRIEVTDLVRHRHIRAIPGDVYIAKAG